MEHDCAKSWYLIQLKPNSHQIAARNLIRQGFEIFLPLQEVTKRKEAKFANVLRPLFPGYMFVSFDPESAPWRKINSTLGVARLVGFGVDPAIVPLQFITDLKNRCDANGKIIVSQSLCSGDDVFLLSGPFANFVATVEQIDPEKRVWLLLNFMEKTMRIQAKPEQLALAGGQPPAQSKLV